MIDSHDLSVGADAFLERGEQVVPDVTFAYVVVTCFGGPGWRRLPDYMLEVGVPLSKVRRAIATVETCEDLRETLGNVDPDSELVQGLVTMHLDMADAVMRTMLDTATGADLDVYMGLIGI